MDSWQASHASPELKFEHSPAESLLSIPGGDMYPSLFGSADSGTVVPTDMMTPGSLDDDVDLALPSDSRLSAEPSADASTDKKPTKKRKSWGQVLPEPKTNLPPRKRAKTEDEKEQRRVERVLRNRRAAQSSRERKRLEVEALEEKNKVLEQQVLHFQKVAMLLTEELQKTRRNNGEVIPHQGPLTLSQELFSSHDGHSATGASGISDTSFMAELLRSAQSPTTVDPASLSPAMSPAAEPVPFPEQTVAVAKPTTAAEPAAPKAVANPSPDSTQHPAEMLCSDLQCRSAEASQQPLPTVLALAQPQALPRPLPPAVMALYWQLSFLLTSAATIFSACRRPLTQIAMSWRAGFSLAPTALILNTIIWLVTRPSRSRHRRTASTSSRLTNTSTTPTTSSNSPRPLPAAPLASPSAASAASSSTPSTTLRLRLLRKILTCSPSLARPLSDATLAALRLVRSEERRGVDRVNGNRNGLGASLEPDADPSSAIGEDGAWLPGAALPSKELLLTLLWAIKVEERMITIRQQRNEGSSPGRLPQSAAKIRRTTSTKPEICVEYSASQAGEGTAHAASRRRL